MDALDILWYVVLQTLYSICITKSLIWQLQHSLQITDFLAVIPGLEKFVCSGGLLNETKKVHTFAQLD